MKTIPIEIKFQLWKRVFFYLGYSEIFKGILLQNILVVGGKTEKCPKGICERMNEPMYCSQQIKIPPELPDIMKQFTKAAIRTQPPDVLKWSAGYFQALANGETLPVKERLETAVATQKTDTGLTPGLVSVLHRQLGTRQEVTYNELFEKWQALCLPTGTFSFLFPPNLNWASSCFVYLKFEIEIQTLFTLFQYVVTPFLMKKSTASCFESSIDT